MSSQTDGFIVWSSDKPSFFFERWLDVVKTAHIENTKNDLQQACYYCEGTKQKRKTGIMMQGYTSVFYTAIYQIFWDKYILSILLIGLLIFNLDLLLIILLPFKVYNIFVWNCIHHALKCSWASAKKKKKMMCLYCHLTCHLIFFVFCTDSHNGYGIGSWH